MANAEPRPVGPVPAEPAGRRGRVEIRDLTKRYETKRGRPVLALQEVSTTVAPGEFVTLVGPSGCGKTTLLNILAGLVPATAGTVTVDEQQVGHGSRRPGMVFQAPILLPWRTAEQNVYLPAEVGAPPARRGNGRELRDRARHLLDLVGLGAFKDKYPWELSGGMQARVAIARALLLDSSLMCMDEPFAALDEFTREQMLLELLDIWNAQGFSAVFVTHNIFEAVFLSDRVLVMTPRPGKVVADIAIDLPRPRRREMIGSDAFSANVRSVRDAMQEYWEIAS